MPFIILDSSAEHCGRSEHPKRTNSAPCFRIKVMFDVRAFHISPMERKNMDEVVLTPWGGSSALCDISNVSYVSTHFLKWSQQ